MRDFKEYYKRMGANIEEKIDFVVAELANDEYKYVLDFGCADGQTTRALAEVFPNIIFIGYDIRKEVIATNIKNNNYDNIVYFDELRDFDLSETLVLFSSVLHEVFSPQEDKEDAQIYCEGIETILKLGRAKSIAIRDMYFNNKKDLENKSSKLEEIDQDKSFKEFFETRNGYLSNRNITEYLLKREYKRNWKEELKEDYFSTPWEDIENHLPFHKVVYYHIYMNLYLKENIPYLKYFTNTTHKKVIYKRLL